MKNLMSMMKQAQELQAKVAEFQAELVKFGPGFIELHTLEGAPQNLAQDLARKMQAWSGKRWIVSLSEERGLEPLGARRRAENAQAVEELRKHPVVKSVMQHFGTLCLRTMVTPAQLPASDFVIRPRSKRTRPI